MAAARIAKEVASGWAQDGRPRATWPARSGLGTKLPSLGHITFEELRDAYEEQARGLLEGGVDLFVIETCMDLLQAKAVMVACRRAMKAQGRPVPLQVQVTIETTGRMLVGSEIGVGLTSLLAMKPDVLGLNCATGPTELTEHLRHLSQHRPRLISVLPNAGLPSVVDGRTHARPDRGRPGPRHSHHVDELGIGIVGGCCGTTPGHLPPWSRLRRTWSRSAAAPLRAERDVDHRAGPSPGRPELPDRRRAHERQRVQGVPEALLAEDWDGCASMAPEQIREWRARARRLRRLRGRDGVRDMDEVVRASPRQASVPLIIDSTEPPVMEAGLNHSAAGPCSTRRTSRTASSPSR